MSSFYRFMEIQYCFLVLTLKSVQVNTSFVILLFIQYLTNDDRTVFHLIVMITTLNSLSDNLIMQISEWFGWAISNFKMCRMRSWKPIGDSFINTCYFLMRRWVYSAMYFMMTVPCFTWFKWLNLNSLFLNIKCRD